MKITNWSKMNFLGIPDIVLSKTSNLSLNAGFYIIEIYISSFCRRSIISKCMHYVNWNIYQMDKTVAHIHVYRNKNGKSNWVFTKLNFKKQIIIYKSHIRTNITIRNTIRVQTIDRHFWPNIFDPSLITSSSYVFHFLRDQ